MRAFEFDRLFDELAPAFRSGSSRLVLEALARLVEAAADRIDLARPYLEELAPELGRLLSARAPRGLAPERMENVWRAFASVQAPAEAVGRIRLLAALAYAWVGDWVGVSRSLDVPQPPEGHVGDRREVPGRDVLIDWLHFVRERHSEHVAALSDLLAAWDRERERVSDGFAVPVLQPLADCPLPLLGRLRQVSMDLVRASGEGPDAVHAAVALAENRPGSPFASRAVSAARALLQRRSLVRAGDRFSARIVFEEGVALHEGSSADLAIGALFFSQAADLAESRFRHALRPAVAMTGGLSADGTVLPVDLSSLTLKIEAAFFSPVKILVVPELQREEAIRVADALHARYPGRSLGILGVRTLEEVFFDVRVARETVLPTWHFAAKWIWRRKFTAGGIATSLVLAVTLGILIYSQIDSNPVKGRLAVDRLILTNQYGRDVRSLVVGEALVDLVGNTGLREYAQPFDLFDLDGDGDRDVCYGLHSDTGGDVGTVACISTGRGAVHWRRPLRRNLRYPHLPPGGSTVFRPRHLHIAPCGDSPRACLYVSAVHAQYFAALILKFDALTGEELAVYVNNGGIRYMTVTERGPDGIPLILFGATSQHFGEPVLGVLDSRFIGGQSPSGGDYVAEGIGSGLERTMVRFPLTPVGQVAKYLHQFRLAGPIDLSDSSFTVRYWDTASGPLFAGVDSTIACLGFGAGMGDYVQMTGRDAAGTWIVRLDSLYRRTPLPRAETLLAEFGFDFVARRVWSSSHYDLMAQFLVDRGFLGAAPDPAYWETYRQSLLYWNGDDWVTEPVMNRHYLEAAGHD